MVSVLLVGFATPPPLAVPATVTVVFGASTSLLVAVMVTVPVELVLPAAMVSRLLVLSVKAPVPLDLGRRHVHRHRRAGFARQARGHRGRPRRSR